jgi:SAM-dependent methyltransferase
MRRGALVTAVDYEMSEMSNALWMMRSLRAGDPAVTINGGVGSVAVSNALALPFPSESFDRIIAAEVLEHIPDDLTAISELARVLKPGGTMAVTVPRWGPELLTWAISDEYHSKPGGHIRIYRRKALMSRLEDHGLRVFCRHHAHSLHSPYWWLKALVGVDDDQHPFVRAYHKLLVWDIVAGTPFTRLPERMLNPFIGKSLVLYAEKRP